MITGISAVTLATHDMAPAVRFYRALGFELLYQPVAEVPADQAGLSATTVTKIDKLSEDVAIRINATAWSV